MGTSCILRLGALVLYLVLLLLEGTLGLLKSSLQLLLLDLEPPPLLVQLVDGAATIAKLVKQVLDLIGKVLEKWKCLKIGIVTRA